MVAERSGAGDDSRAKSPDDNAENPTEGLLEDVLKQTLSEGKAEDVSEALRRARRDVPNASHNDLEALTRFAMYFLKKRFPRLPLREGALLAMSASLAQTLAEDPAAQSRLAQIWPELSES